MSGHAPRKRIPYNPNKKKAIEDPLAFVKNKCTDQARKVIAGYETISIDIWIDKHCQNRLQHGDENGKRDGIESEAVGELVLSSMKHLFFYSAYHPGFTFVNHEPQPSFRSIRTVLNAGGRVNVECCY